MSFEPLKIWVGCSVIGCLLILVLVLVLTASLTYPTKITFQLMSSFMSGHRLIEKGWCEENLTIHHHLIFLNFIWDLSLYPLPNSSKMLWNARISLLYAVKRIIVSQMTNRNGLQSQYENGIKHEGPKWKIWNVKGQNENNPKLLGLKVCSSLFLFILKYTFGP